MAGRKTVASANSTIAGLLRDLAAVQTSTQRKWAYARAADAIAGLDAPIESFLLPDGTLRKIAHVGPSSTRVIVEVLRTGGSPTVERALAESGKMDVVEKGRALRDDTFLDRTEVLAAYFGIMRAGLVAVPVSTKLPQETIDYIVDDAARQLPFVSVEVTKGDALFFSTFLIHRSGENTSNSIRWSCHFRYNNLCEPTFIQRGFPHSYIYKPQDELITPGFPSAQDVYEAFE